MSKTDIKSKKSGQGRGIRVFTTILCILIIAILAASIVANIILYKKISEASAEALENDVTVISALNQMPRNTALLNTVSEEDDVAENSDIMRRTVKLPYVYENTQGQTFGIVPTYETEFGLDDYTLIYFGDYKDEMYDYYDNFEAMPSSVCTLVLNDNAFSIIGSDEHIYYFANTGTNTYTTIRSIFELDGFDKYIVKFDSNGGTEIPDIGVDYYTILSPLPVPTKEGYTFVGWFDESGVQYIDQEIRGNMTLTARWRSSKIKVTFYVDGEIYLEKLIESGAVFA